MLRPSRRLTRVRISLTSSRYRSRTPPVRTSPLTTALTWRELRGSSPVCGIASYDATNSQTWRASSYSRFYSWGYVREIQIRYVSTAEDMWERFRSGMCLQLRLCERDSDQVYVYSWGYVREIQIRYVSTAEVMWERFRSGICLQLRICERDSDQVCVYSWGYVREIQIRYVSTAEVMWERFRSGMCLQLRICERDSDQVCVYSWGYVREIQIRYV